MSIGLSELLLVAVIFIVVMKPDEAVKNIKAFASAMAEVKKSGQEVAKDLNDLTKPAKDAVSDMKETAESIKDAVDITK